MLVIYFLIKKINQEFKTRYVLEGYFLKYQDGDILNNII